MTEKWHVLVVYFDSGHVSLLGFGMQLLFYWLMERINSVSLVFHCLPDMPLRCTSLSIKTNRKQLVWLCPKVTKPTHQLLQSSLINALYLACLNDKSNLCSTISFLGVELPAVATAHLVSSPGLNRKI